MNLLAELDLGVSDLSAEHVVVFAGGSTPAVADLLDGVGDSA